ncbi:MAG: HlyD family type I secretion periplasmic adaptor subunit [Magnetococcales bacterium]|nr:HlyD family type I secretion periplasmic adaptor subunit [Magnetococcales bacterium]
MQLFPKKPDPLHLRPLETIGDTRDTGSAQLIRETWRIILVVFIPLLIWSLLADLKDVSHVQGQIMPSGSVHAVQHMEGGIVTELLVHESELVEQNQVLFRLDQNQSKPEQEQIELKIASLKANAIRLRALETGTTPDFSELRPRFAALAAAQENNYRHKSQSLTSNLAVLDAQITQRRLDLQEVQSTLEVAKQQKSVTGSLLAIRQELMENKAISRVIYLETKRAHVIAQGEVDRLQKQIANIQGAITETEQRRNKLISDARHEAGSDLAVTMNELSQVRDSLTRIDDQVKRLEVLSPVRGIVQELKVQTVGVVVQPGEILAQIVPTNDHLQVEVRIPPQEVGRIAKGQEVMVKLSSYDFSRFGAIDGHLTDISPSTLTQEGGPPYYKGIVALTKDYVGDTPGTYRILPGMLAQVDITLGSRSVLATLLHPISKTVQEAFKER